MALAPLWAFFVCTSFTLHETASKSHVPKYKLILVMAFFSSSPPAIIHRFEFLGFWHSKHGWDRNRTRVEGSSCRHRHHQRISDEMFVQIAKQSVFFRTAPPLFLTEPFLACCSARARSAELGLWGLGACVKTETCNHAFLTSDCCLYHLLCNNCLLSRTLCASAYTFMNRQPKTIRFRCSRKIITNGVVFLINYFLSGIPSVDKMSVNTFRLVGFFSKKKVRRFILSYFIQFSI